MSPHRSGLGQCGAKVRAMWRREPEGKEEEPALNRWQQHPSCTRSCLLSRPNTTTALLSINKFWKENQQKEHKTMTKRTRVFFYAFAPAWSRAGGPGPDLRSGGRGATRSPNPWRTRGSAEPWWRRRAPRLRRARAPSALALPPLDPVQ
jgi:hypothetical protein